MARFCQIQVQLVHINRPPEALFLKTKHIQIFAVLHLSTLTDDTEAFFHPGDLVSPSSSEDPRQDASLRQPLIEPASHDAWLIEAPDDVVDWFLVARNAEFRPEQIELDGIDDGQSPDPIMPLARAEQLKVTIGIGIGLVTGPRFGRGVTDVCKKSCEESLAP